MKTCGPLFVYSAVGHVFTLLGCEGTASSEMYNFMDGSHWSMHSFGIRD